jgi:hypothetical protein
VLSTTGAPGARSGAAGVTAGSATDTVWSKEPVIWLQKQGPGPWCASIAAWWQASVAFSTTPPGPAANQQVAASQNAARIGA